MANPFDARKSRPAPASPSPFSGGAPGAGMRFTSPPKPTPQAKGFGQGQNVFGGQAAGGVPDRRDVADAGEIKRWITLPNGQVIPIKTPSGSQHLLRTKGSSFFFDPKDNHPYKLDARSPSGIKSAFEDVEAMPDGAGRLVKKVAGQTLDVGEDAAFVAKQAAATAKGQAAEEKKAAEAAKKAESEAKKAEAAGLRTAKAEALVTIGSAKEILAENERQLHLESTSSAKRARMIAEDLRSDGYRLDIVDKALEEASDPQIVEGLKKEREGLTALMEGKRKQQETFELDAQRAALREEEYLRGQIGLESELNRKKLAVATMTNTGRLPSVESTTGINAPVATPAPATTAKPEVPLGQAALDAGEDVSAVVRSLYAQQDSQVEAYRQWRDSVKIDGVMIDRANSPDGAFWDGKRWLDVVPGMKLDTAKEVRAVVLPKVEGMTLAGDEVKVGESRIGEVWRDEAGVPSLLMARNAPGVRSSPSLRSGNPYDGVPEYAEVSPQFIDGLQREGAFAQTGEAIPAEMTRKAQEQWAAQRWDDGQVNGLLTEWRSGNDRDRAEIVKRLQPEAAFAEPNNPQSWRLDTRKLYLGGQISLQQARLLEREFYGVQPGIKPLGKAWEEFKSGESETAQRLAGVVGNKLSSRRQIVGALEQASSAFLADYYKANGHRADFDLAEYNQLRESLAAGEAGSAWWTAQVDNALQNAVGSSAGMLVGVGKFFGTLSQAMGGPKVGMSPEEFGMVSDATLYTGAAMRRNLADRGLFTPSTWWEGKEGKAVTQSIDLLFAKIDNESLTETDFDDLAKEIARSSIQQSQRLGTPDEMQTTPEGWELAREDLLNYYDPSSPQSPLAGLLMAYQATRDPAIRAQFEQMVRSSPDEMEFQERTAAYASAEGTISENDFAGPLRLGFRGGQVAPIQESIVEILSDITTAGMGKALATGVRGAKKVQEAGKAMNIAQRAALGLSRMGERFVQMGLREGKPLQNLLVQGAKQAVTSGITEGAEEFVGAWGQTGATLKDAFVQGLQGAIGGLGLAPIMGGAGLAVDAFQQMRTQRAEMKGFADFAAQWTKDHPDDPIDAAGVKQMAGYMPPAYRAENAAAMSDAVEKIKQALVASQQAAKDGPPSPEVMAPIEEAYATALDTLKGHAAELRLRTVAAKEAMQEINGIADPTHRAFADAALKARMGQKLAPREVSALLNSVDETGQALAEETEGGWRFTEAGLNALAESAPMTRESFFPAEENEVTPSPERMEANGTPVSTNGTNQTTNGNTPISGQGQAEVSGVPVPVPTPDGAVGDESSPAAPTPAPSPATTAPAPAPTEEGTMHYVPVKITLPGGAVKTMDLEQMATSPEEAAQRVAQSPVMQAYQRRGATVEVGNTASAAPAEATTPTPAETKRETTLPQPAANARNLPQAAASGAETSAETALPETDLGREEPAAAIAAALASKQATQKAEVRPWRKVLEGVATMFGHKLVDTGLPFGYVDQWGKFHSFGTQLLDKMHPGDAIGQWIDKVGNASPEVAAKIAANMSQPFYHRVWFGHDPAANIATIVDKFGVGAVPDYIGQLLKDFMTKAGVPLPGTQWLVHSGLVGDETATKWLSLNVGEAFSGGLALLGSWKLMKKARAGQDIHAGWAMAGIAFKLAGGVMQANPVLLLSGLSDTVVLTMAKPEAVKAAFEQVAERGDQAPEETETAETEPVAVPEEAKVPWAKDLDFLPAARLYPAMQALEPRLRMMAWDSALRLNATLALYAETFPAGIRFSDKREANLWVNRDGTLNINLPFYLRDTAHTTTREAIMAMVEEELAHIAAMRVMTDTEVVDLWNSLPAAMQRQVYKAYHVSDIAHKRVPSEPKGDWGSSAWNYGHEFVRMLVTDREFQGRVAEAVEVDPGFGAKIVAWLKTFIARLRKGIEALPPAQRSAVKEYEYRVRQALREMLKLPPLQKPTAEQTRSTGQRIEKLRAWMRSQPRDASVWAALTDKGDVLSIPGNAATTPWDARKQLASQARLRGQWLAWDAGLAGLNVPWEDVNEELNSWQSRSAQQMALLADPSIVESLKGVDDTLQMLPMPTEEDYSDIGPPEIEEAQLQRATLPKQMELGLDPIARRRDLRGKRDMLVRRIEGMTGLIERKVWDTPEQEAKLRKDLARYEALLAKVEGKMLADYGPGEIERKVDKPVDMQNVNPGQGSKPSPEKAGVAEGPKVDTAAAVGGRGEVRSEKSPAAEGKVPSPADAKAAAIAYQEEVLADGKATEAAKEKARKILAKLRGEAMAEPVAVPKVETVVEPSIPAKPAAGTLNPNDPNIGREWNAPYGRQRVIKAEFWGGRWNYEVETVGTSELRNVADYRLEQTIERNEYDASPEGIEAKKERTARYERELQREAEAAAKKAELTAKTAEYLDTLNLSPMVRGKLAATLDVQIGYRYGATEYSGDRAQVLRRMIDDGFTVETEEVPAMKEVSRRRYNQMDAAEQTAYERKLKQAGTKTEYRLVSPKETFFTITKAEYDYAQWLLNQKATAPAVSNDSAPALPAAVEKDDGLNIEKMAVLVAEEGTTWAMDGGLVKKAGFGHWTLAERDAMRSRFDEAGFKTSIFNNFKDSLKSTFRVSDGDNALRTLQTAIFDRDVAARNADKEAKKQEEEDRRQKELAQIDPAVRRFIDQHFEPEFANAYNQLQLSDFLTGKTAKFHGMITRRWLSGIQSLGIPVPEDGTVNWEMVKKRFEDFRTEELSPPAEEAPGLPPAAPVTIGQENINARPSVAWADVSTPGTMSNPNGTLRAAATQSQAPSGVWYYQGDLQQLAFNERATVNGQSSATPYGQQVLAEAKAAKAAGWTYTNVRSSRMGTVWVFRKGDQVLTRAGAAALASGKMERPDVQPSEAGYQSMIDRFGAYSAKLVEWLQTLKPSTLDSASALSNKLGNGLISKWVRLVPNPYSTGERFSLQFLKEDGATELALFGDTVDRIVEEVARYAAAWRDRTGEGIDPLFRAISYEEQQANVWRKPSETLAALGFPPVGEEAPIAPPPSATPTTRLQDLNAPELLSPEEWLATGRSEEEHRKLIREAMGLGKRRPVNATTVAAYEMTPPALYVRKGEQLVYGPLEAKLEAQKQRQGKGKRGETSPAAEFGSRGVVEPAPVQPTTAEAEPATFKELDVLLKAVIGAEKKLDKLHGIPANGVYQHVTRAKATTRNANLSWAAESLDEAKRQLTLKIRELLRQGVAVPERYLEKAKARAEYNEQGNYDPIQVGAADPVQPTTAPAETALAAFVTNYLDPNFKRQASVDLPGSIAKLSLATSQSDVRQVLQTVADMVPRNDQGGMISGGAAHRVWNELRGMLAHMERKGIDKATPELAPVQPTTAAAETPAKAEAKVEEHLQDVKATEGTRPAAEIKAELLATVTTLLKETRQRAAAETGNGNLSYEQLVKAGHGDMVDNMSFEKREFQIPGDGTFTMVLNGRNLAELLKRIKALPVKDTGKVESSRGGAGEGTAASAKEVAAKLYTVAAVRSWVVNAINGDPFAAKVIEAYRKTDNPEGIKVDEIEAEVQALLNGEETAPVEPATPAEAVPESTVETPALAPEAAPASPVVENVAKAKKKRAEAAAKIEDFGEKIGGARKDVWGKMRLQLDAELPAENLDITMSKHWPEPNYEALIAQGVDAEGLAAMKALRDMIPTKPQRGYQVQKWAQAVRYAHGLMQEILKNEGQIPAEMRERIQSESPLIAMQIRLYQQVGFPLVRQLKGWKLEYNTYSYFRGIDLKPGQIVVTASHKGRTAEGLDGKSLFGVAELKDYATWESATDGIIARIKERLESEAAADPEGTKPRVPARPMENYKIYQDRFSREYFIGRRGINGVVRMKAGFTSVAGAREYLVENKDAIEAHWESLKIKPNYRNPINAARQGPARRGDEVSPGMFQEAFGFRGVEFGNWVEDKRRQEDLNEAYDALVDLAEVLDVPTQALSLDGSLGLAFGARGHSGAKAHYEPGSVVINLTKESGPGSLAHEWWHGLDNYFARYDQRGETQAVPLDRMITKISGPAKNIRPEVLAAFQRIAAAVGTGPFAERSKKLDDARSKPYYGTTVEKTARAFERYVRDRLAEKLISNDYLVNIGKDESEALPTAEEMRNGIKAAYDALFDALETKETERGQMLFTGNRAAPASPIDTAAQGAATAVGNGLAEPTEAQKEAGNYAKGHVRIGGLDISIENPAGSVRRGVGADGKAWETPMVAHYGYVRGTEGPDGDHLDVFIAPGTPAEFRGTVYVVEQTTADGKAFDEHKAVFGRGIDSPEAAGDLYHANYEADWKGGYAIQAMPWEQFKVWAQSPLAAMPLEGRTLATGNRAAPAASDAEYLAALKAGDMETAQRMVDEAAKAAGFNIGPVFHGTKGKRKGVFPFTVFDTNRRGQNTLETGHKAGSYFAEDRRYAEGAAYSQTNMGRNGKPVVGMFFLRKDAQRTPGVESAVEYVATDPNQIKSADPVTYDDAGNIIPLSQRFNPGSDSILYTSNRSAPAASYAGAKEEAAKRGAKAAAVKRSSVLTQVAGQRVLFKRDARSFWADVVSGNIDRIDYYAPGFRNIWLDTERQMALARAAVNSLFETLNARARRGFGYPAWWKSKAVRAKWQEFQNVMLPTAARLEASGVNERGEFEFKDFLMRAGRVPVEVAEKNGLSVGDEMEIDGERLRLGPAFSVRESNATTGKGKLVSYHLLLRPISAAEQAATYKAFVDDWAAFPVAKELLDEFIMPGLDKGRFIGPRQFRTAEFNRYSLRDVYNEWPDALREQFGALPELEFSDGYVPEVPIKSGISAIAGGVFAELLRSYQSPARRFAKQGLRESGDVKNLFEGFQTQLMQAHMEKVRMERRGRLLKAAAVPEAQIPVADRHLWMPVNDAFEMVYEAVVLARNLDRGAFPALTGALNPQQVDLMRSIVGEAWMLRGRAMQIPAAIYNEMLAEVATAQTENLLLKLWQWFMQQFNAASLASPQYLAMNFIGNEILRTGFIVQSGYKAMLFAMSGRMEDKARARLALSTARYLMQGAILDRFPLRRERFREILPREIFDTNHFYNALQGMDEGVLDNVKKLQFGSAFLAAVRAGNWDVGAKVQLANAMYQAYAREAWRDAAKRDVSLTRLSKEKKRQWLKDYVATAPATVHREVEMAAGEWLMNYENTPRWMNSGAIKPFIDPTKPGKMSQAVMSAQLKKLAIAAFIPFLRWSYLFVRKVKRTAIDEGVRNIVGATGNTREGIANLMALGTLVAAPAMLTFLKEPGGDDDKWDKVEAQLLGRSRDMEGKDLDRTLKATNRFNVSALARIAYAKLGFMEDYNGEAFTVTDNAGQKADVWLRYRNYPFIKEGIVLGLWLQALRGSNAPVVDDRIKRSTGNAAGNITAKDAFGQSWQALTGEYVSLGLGYTMLESVLAGAMSGSQSADAMNDLRNSTVDLLTSPVLPHRLMRDIGVLVDPTDRRSRPSARLGYDPGWLETFMARIPGLKSKLPLDGEVAAPTILSAKSSVPPAEQAELLKHYDIPATAVTYSKDRPSRDAFADLRMLKDLGAGPQDVGLSMSKTTKSAPKPLVAFPKPDQVRQRNRWIEALRMTSPINTLPVNQTAYRAAVTATEKKD